MKKDIEKRNFKVEEFRVKRNEDKSITLEGYSAVFEKPSEDLGWGDNEVREYISKGAFTNALKNSDCRATFNHDANYVLGRESAGTLSLHQDETGLRSIINLPDTQFARDLVVSIERGDIKEQSFAFVVAKDTWEEDRDNKLSKRTISEIKELIDVSVVTYPSYPDTSISKRSYDQYQKQSKTAENGEAISADNSDFEKQYEDLLISTFEN